MASDLYYDLPALADAVRRDMRREQELVYTDTEYAFIHAYNVHKAKQMLDVINPKHTKPTQQ